MKFNTFRKELQISLIVLIVMFAVSLYYYDKMPDILSSHWNGEGESDGEISKFWGLFLIPLISFGAFLFLVFIPKLDPLKKNIEKFLSPYYRFIIALLCFLLYIHLLTIIWNLGYKFNFNQALAPGIGVLFFMMGFFMEKTQRNWFIGIRTPWTLNSDYVWNKTHKLGGHLFKISGVLSFIGVFVPEYALWLILAPIILSVLVTCFYSYMIYKNEKKK